MVFVWKYTNPAATFLLRHAAESHHHVYCVLFKTSLLLSAGYCTSSKIVALFWVIWGKNSNKSLWSSDRRRTCWSFGKARGVKKNPTRLIFEQQQDVWSHQSHDHLTDRLPLVSPQTASPASTTHESHHHNTCSRNANKQTLLHETRVCVSVCKRRPSDTHGETPRERGHAVNRELMNIWNDLKWDLNRSYINNGSADNTGFTVETKPDRRSSVKIERASWCHHYRLRLCSSWKRSIFSDIWHHVGD